MICCCTDTPHCQSFGRTPQPLSRAGLVVVVALPNLPKFRALPVRAAHVSTEPFAGFCTAKLSRSQSTTLSPSLSVQARSIVLTARLAGLLVVYRPSFVADTR